MRKICQLVVTVMALVLAGVPKASALDCFESSDKAVLESLKAQTEPVATDCFSNLVIANNFESAIYAVDTLKETAQLDEAIEALRQASSVVHSKYETILSKIEEQKKAPVKVTPPFTWYQDLYKVYIEVKHANRFDVAGCAMLFNETINITNDKFHVSASCAESQETKILYELKFKFWAPVNATTMTFTRKPVGKFLFTIRKADAPGRWRTLHKEGTKRPHTMKLDIDKLQQHHYSLSDFEDDEIEDFEGHDLFEYDEGPDSEDMTWLFPTKGPGKFKDLDKKKKKKKKKGKKGKGKKQKQTQE